MTTSNLNRHWLCETTEWINLWMKYIPCVLAWTEDKWSFKFGCGNFTTQESKAGISCVSHTDTPQATQVAPAALGWCTPVGQSLLPARNTSHCTLLHGGRSLAKPDCTATHKLCCTPRDEILMISTISHHISLVSLFPTFQFAFTKLPKLLYCSSSGRGLGRRASLKPHG